MRMKGTYMEEIKTGLRKIYVYVDESGSITKTNVSNNQYFVISLIFTDNPVKVRRLFKKKISQMMRKNNKYEEMIRFNKEIKGSDISETVKKNIYEYILQYASDVMELGVIILDNNYTRDKFIENHARTFNYMIQVYMDSYFRNHSKYMNSGGTIEFIIDEQNVATGAKYELEEYLNQQLTICNPICDQFSVTYTDSKNEKLVQLADFVANTFYRNIEKKNQESKETVKMLSHILCNGDIFDFSESHDIRLNL